MILLKKALIYFLYILGVLGIFHNVTNYFGDEMENTATDLILTISLLLMGYLVQRSMEIQYKGGVPSLLGVTFFFFGIFACASVFNDFMKSENIEIAELTVALALIFIGMALVVSGHNYHKLRKEKEISAE